MFNQIHPFRRLFVITSLTALFAMPWAGATAATGGQGAAPAFASPYVHTSGWPTGPISAKEIRILSRGVNQKDIVILRNQFGHMARTDAASLSARTSAIESAEAPLLRELRQVGAKAVRPYRIINAVSATVSRAEAQRLRSNPAVRAVVPNAIIKEPQSMVRSEEGGLAAETATAKAMAASIGARVSHLDRSKRNRHAGATTSCTYSAPTLAPEALSLTQTASDKSGTPEAQDITTGSGVVVAFMADAIDPYNPDFVRPDGSMVFAHLKRDIKDFTGEGYFAPSDAEEGFGDASSVAAQGNTTFNTNSFLLNKGTGDCANIRIVGVAPGAELMSLKVFGGAMDGTTSNFIQAIQYAVTHGADVLNQSFGSNPFPDFDEDPTALADQAAIDAGVTVVVSSGDSGTTGTLGTPSTLPGAISVGATTQFLSYKQSDFYGYDDFGAKGYVDNNISSFSSGGVSQAGLKTPDVVAPGDLGWALCSDNYLLYPGCSNLAGLPSSFQLFGGTSESSPLTAGEAALVISAYAKTHNGDRPTPAVVKQIIMSTATDLGEPTYEQGAGLINSLAAVQAAESFGGAPAVGSSIVTSASPLHATGTGGTSKSFSVTATNDGTKIETLKPLDRKLGSPTESTTTVQLDPKTDASFTDEIGAVRIYTTQTFTVPAGVDRLDAAIAWNVVAEPGTLVRLTLLNPSGKYAAYTEPQDPGPPFQESGYGHVDVRSPGAGTWTAVIWGRKSSAPGIPAYSGPVVLSTSTSNWVSAGTVTPASKTLAPGQSQTFTVNTEYATKAGDENQNVSFRGLAGAIPVIMRTKVPTTATGGSFSGTLTGGNGRYGSPGQTLNYVFSVPSGVNSLGISLHTPQNYNLEAILVDPNGMPVDTQSNIASLDLNPNHETYLMPKTYRDTIQLDWRAPEPGMYQLIFIINDNISGTATSAPFTGTISFGSSGVSSSGVPDSAGTMVSASSGATAKITVKNNGNTTKMYFVDPRTSSYTDILVGAGSGIIGGAAELGPAPWPLVSSFVPPHSTQFVVGAESPDHALSMDCFDEAGAPPFGGLGSPDVEGESGRDLLTAAYLAVVDVDVANIGGTQVPAGPWGCSLSENGPFNAYEGAPVADISIAGNVITQAFNGDIETSTGDIYPLYMGLSQAPYSPLVLKPGQSGTINVQIGPASGEKGQTVSGNLYVDAMDTQSADLYSFTGVGDQVGSVHYQYTVSS